MPESKEIEKIEQEKAEKEKQKEKNIDREISRLKKTYAFLPKGTPKDAPERDAVKEKIGRIMPLIKNAAFLIVTLEELQEVITKDGTTQPYQNGKNQKGVKKSAAAELYNTMVKTLGNVLKQLDEMARAGSPTETKKIDPLKAIRDRGKK